MKTQTLTVVRLTSFAKSSIHNPINNHMKQPELKEIKAAYEVADENGKSMLRALYPDVFNQPQKRAKSNRPVTERVKTFDDACHELGETHPLVQHLNLVEHHLADHLDGMDDVLAYLKMRIVVAALNEGWTPDWGNKDEYKWYPWFYILTEEEYNDLDDDAKCRVVGRAYNNAYANGGLVYANASYVSTSSYTYDGSRLAFKSKELAVYAGQQFGELWASSLIG